MSAPNANNMMLYIRCSSTPVVTQDKISSSNLNKFPLPSISTMSRNEKTLSSPWFFRFDESDRTVSTVDTSSSSISSSSFFQQCQIINDDNTNSNKRAMIKYGSRRRENVLREPRFIVDCMDNNGQAILLSTTNNKNEIIQYQKFPTLKKKKNQTITRVIASGIVLVSTLVAGPIGFLFGSFVALRICRWLMTIG